MNPTSRLIVALDLPERSKIISLAKDLNEKVGMVKVGLEAFISNDACTR